MSDSTWCAEPAMTAEVDDDRGTRAAVAGRRGRPLSFEFRVSRDQEWVHLRAHRGDQCIDLGVRSHHYLLLLLAKKRTADLARGMADDDAGWVYRDRLCAMLGADPEHANVMVFRGRRQFKDHGLDAARLVERRPSSRQLRFGFRHSYEAPWAE